MSCVAGPALKVELASGFFYSVEPDVTITIGHVDPDSDSPLIALTVRACPRLAKPEHAFRARKLPVPVQPPSSVPHDLDVLRAYPPTPTGLPSTIGRKFILTGLKLGSGSFGEVFIGFDHDLREKVRDRARYVALAGYSYLAALAARHGGACRRVACGPS